ncbi:MAG TPA: hypothetical protein VG476_06785 [Acidimicrobiales bacterium]|nr:hypothetical protein [Acidimicrobiales bacterium]
MRKTRVGIAGLGALGLVVAGAGTAAAVSTGGYSPRQQDCAPNADASTTQGAQPGCHNLKINVSDGSGRRYAQFGSDQEAQNQNPHGFDVSVTPNGQTPGQAASGPAVGAHVENGSPPSVTPSVQPGTPDGSAANLLTGGQVYFGADDNLDFGEHDGVNGQYGTTKAANGPSDGGNLAVNWHPGQTTTWLADLMVLAHGGSPAPIAENPVPVADAGGGGCADGTCIGVYTARRSIYQGGGGSGSSRNAYNYQGKTWDPYDCNSGDPKSEQACITEGGHTMDWYRQQEARNVYVEPGVTVYEDPDPQASPAGPTQLYPLPAAYVGTCGAAAGGGAVKAPASPVTNKAGQVVVSPTKC